MSGICIEQDRWRHVPMILFCGASPPHCGQEPDMRLTISALEQCHDCYSNSIVLLPLLGSLLYSLVGDGSIINAVVGYGLSFIPYLYLVWFMGRRPSIDLSERSVLFGVTIASLPLLICEPILSEDIWRYVWDGFRVGSGQNPYCFAPQDSALDSFSAQYKLADIRQEIGHAHLPTIYPPIAQLIFSTTSVFSPGSLPLRIFGTLGILLSTHLVSALLEYEGRPKSYVALSLILYC